MFEEKISKRNYKTRPANLKSYEQNELNKVWTKWTKYELQKTAHACDTETLILNISGLKSLKCWTKFKIGPH